MFKDGDDIFFSQLTKYKVYGSDGKSIGRIGDALLKKDNLSLSSLILYGSFLEEKLESVGLRDDVDPIVSVSDIQSEEIQEKKIIISKSKAEIPTTTSKWEAPADHWQFSKLKKIPVFGKDAKKIGTIIDICFHNDGLYTLVLGGGFLEEFLESIKIFPDKDLLVPSSSIKEIKNDQILLKESEIDLRTTLQSEITPQEVFKNRKIGFVQRGSTNLNIELARSRAQRGVP